MNESPKEHALKFSTWLHKNNWHPSTPDKWKNPKVKFQSVEQWNDSFKTIEQLYESFEAENNSQ